MYFRWHLYRYYYIYSRLIWLPVDISIWLLKKWRTFHSCTSLSVLTISWSCYHGNLFRVEFTIIIYVVAKITLGFFFFFKSLYCRLTDTRCSRYTSLPRPEHFNLYYQRRRNFHGKSFLTKQRTFVFFVFCDVSAVFSSPRHVVGISKLYIQPRLC